MTPKKIVVLIDGDEIRRSVTRFMLETLRRRVWAVDSPEAANRITERVDAVLAVWPCDVPAVTAIARRSFTMSIVIAPELQAIPGDDIADLWLFEDQCTPAHIAAAVGIACARKRGPRPASVVNAAAKLASA